MIFPEIKITAFVKLKCEQMENWQNDVFNTLMIHIVCCNKMTFSYTIKLFLILLSILQILLILTLNFSLFSRIFSFLSFHLLFPPSPFSPFEPFFFHVIGDKDTIFQCWAQYRTFSLYSFPILFTGLLWRPFRHLILHTFWNW